MKRQQNNYNSHIKNRNNSQVLNSPESNNLVIDQETQIKQLNQSQISPTKNIAELSELNSFKGNQIEWEKYLINRKAIRTLEEQKFICLNLYKNLTLSPKYKIESKISKLKIQACNSLKNEIKAKKMKDATNLYNNEVKKIKIKSNRNNSNVNLKENIFNKSSYKVNKDYSSRILAYAEKKNLENLINKTKSSQSDSSSSFDSESNTSTYEKEMRLTKRKKLHKRNFYPKFDLIQELKNINDKGLSHQDSKIEKLMQKIMKKFKYDDPIYNKLKANEFFKLKDNLIINKKHGEMTSENRLINASEHKAVVPELSKFELISFIDLLASIDDKCEVYFKKIKEKYIEI